MSHPTTPRNRHSYMGRPTRRTQQPILIEVAGNQLQQRARFVCALQAKPGPRKCPANGSFSGSGAERVTVAFWRKGDIATGVAYLILLLRYLL
jgi:hypothetical protein